MYYTYVLQSAMDKNYYVGFAKNLKLIYEACLDANDAKRREKYLKTYNGRMFLQKRIKSYLTG